MIRDVGLRAVDPLEDDGLIGWFVKIVLAGDTEPIFLGQVTANVLSPLGDVAAVPTGDESPNAYGLEHLLRYQRIDGSYIERGGSAVKIDTLLPFNFAGPTAMHGLRGNRSTRKIGRSYVFSDAPGAQLWTAHDVAEYLLKKCAPKEIGWRLGGQVANLEDRVEAWPSPLTVYDGLAKVIDRRRGCLWRLKPAEQPLVEVFSCLGGDAARVAGVAPNANIVSVDLDALDAPDNVEIKTDAAHRYSEVVVRGGPIVVCETLEYENGLEGAWSEATEAEYKANAKAFLAADDPRKQEKYRGVYTRFVAADNWQGVMPEMEGENITARRRRLFKLGRSFMDRLPLRVGWNYSVNDKTRVVSPYVSETFLQPFVMAKDSGGTLRRLDDPPPRTFLGENPSIGMSMIDGAMGLELRISPGHVMALNHWGDAKRDDTSPIYDYQTLAATVAYASDKAIEARRVIDGDAPRQVLTLSLPQCQGHVVMEGTIVDLDEDGQPMRTPKTRVIRNDYDQLDRLAALAAAWYGRTRRALTFTLPRMEGLPVHIGQMVRSVTVSGKTHDIHSVVTNIEYNGDALQAQVATDFVELDAAAMVGGRGGGKGRLATPSLTTPPADVVESGSGQAAALPNAQTPWSPIRLGRVRDGREMIPPAETIYPPSSDWPAVYFEEHDWRTMQPVDAGATHDQDGKYVPTQARFYGAGPNYSVMEPLRVGSFFLYTTVEASDGEAEHRIIACYNPHRLTEVILVKDGGQAGGSNVTGGDANDPATWGDCSWTYTVRAMDNVTVLGEEMTPMGARIENTEYYYAGEDSAHTGYGFAVFGDDGIELLMAPGEGPKQTDCSV